MDGITLGEIASWVGLIAGIIGGAGVIYKVIASALSKALRRELQPINEKIDAINSKVDLLEAKHDESDMSRVKDFLVEFLARIERGEAVDEEELERFWENYDFYDKHGGNSYVHNKMEKLKSQGKL